jgi:hypothetical protein
LLFFFPTLDANSFVHHFEGDLSLVFPFTSVISPVNSETQKESTFIMTRFRTSAIACLLAAALLATPAVSQDFVVGPLGYSTYRPVVTYSPVITTPGRITAYSPIISSSPQIITYGAPVVTSYRPVVTYPRTVRYRVPVGTYRPVVTYPRTVRYRVPVVTYRPAVVRYRVPVTTYRPIVTGYSPVFVPGGALIVRPKVYVTGQPIRNALRAMTP